MCKENISIFDLMSKPEKINFAFQPIFEIKTGNIYGYEALMRPSPYTPMEVIAEYARFNRLNEIEEFTIYYAAKQFLENNLTGKLFLNSFPSAFVSDEMLEKVHQLVQHKLKNRLVVEMLEYTEFDSHAHYKKTTQFEHSKTDEFIAIDDYGTGKNIDEECIEFYKPDIVKIDRKLIENIHKNITSQKDMLDIFTANKQLASEIEYDLQQLGSVTEIPAGEPTPRKSVLQHLHYKAF